MMGSHQRLADAELAVMRALWDREELTAREIRERLYPEDTAANQGTVQNLLRRLEDKGFVERDRRLFVHRFRPAVSRAEYAGGQLESLAEKVTDGSLVPMLTHLVEANKIPPGELEEIRRLLNPGKE